MTLSTYSCRARRRQCSYHSDQSTGYVDMSGTTYPVSRYRPLLRHRFPRPREHRRLAPTTDERTRQLQTNSLSAAVRAKREADSLYSFKHKFNTHMFTICFNHWLSVVIHFTNL